MSGAPAKAIFTGASGNRLIADVFGESGPSVLLLHGGGTDAACLAENRGAPRAEARHMVAGDSNENFSAAILEFLGRNAGEAPGGTICK